MSRSLSTRTLRRGRKATWKKFRQFFPAESTPSPRGNPIGAGLGFIGNEGFSFLIVKALGNGIYIEKKLPPFNILYKPILIPWEAIARMILRWKPTWSGSKKGIEAELHFWDASPTMVVVPWDTALLSAVPDDIAVDTQDVDT